MTTDRQAEMNDYGVSEDIQFNCDISDARGHDLYSMCTMVLKLRNLYKWQKALEPWEEPEPSDLLEWIDAREHYWQTIVDQPYRFLSFDGVNYSPDDVAAINDKLRSSGLVYGSGYGGSMKAVFFLADRIEQRSVCGCRVIIMGKQRAKEMASPFAMAQQGVVYIHKDNLRYFLWDQIQELRSCSRAAFRHAMELHGVIQNGKLEQSLLKTKFDTIVEEEMDLFVYHEVGEILQTTLDSAMLERIVTTFPASVIELVCRSLKDILADTHPQGLLHHLISERREASLSLYVGLLDGMRKELFPEIFEAFKKFCGGADWPAISRAQEVCRKRSLALAHNIREIGATIGEDSDDYVLQRFNASIIAPLGLDVSK